MKRRTKTVKNYDDLGIETIQDYPYTPFDIMYDPESAYENRFRTIEPPNETMITYKSETRPAVKKKLNLNTKNMNR